MKGKEMRQALNDIYKTMTDEQFSKKDLVEILNDVTGYKFSKVYVQKSINNSIKNFKGVKELKFPQYFIQDEKTKLVYKNVEEGVEE